MDEKNLFCESNTSTAIIQGQKVSLLILGGKSCIFYRACLGFVFQNEKYLKKNHFCLEAGRKVATIRSPVGKQSLFDRFDSVFEAWKTAKIVHM